jgi:ABC-2 type transport system ATP-binding protein
MDHELVSNRSDNSRNLTKDVARRFRVALSFSGEKRDFVAQLAGCLANRFTEEEILYDKYHEAEFSRRDLAFYLPDLYRNQSDLIVVVLCRDYEQKEWCGGLEWPAIFDLLQKRQNKEVMLCRFDLATDEGLFSGAGFVDLDDKTPDQAATLILERLALNESKPKEYYILQTPRKVKQTRDSIRRAVDQIESCFTSADIVTDQIERACDLVLDFTKQFGVDYQHRIKAISAKNDVADLLLRERQGELTPGEFQLECAQLRRRVLELTSAVVDAAESHLSQVEALPVTTDTDSRKIAASAYLVPDDFRISLKKFLQHESGDNIVFRCEGLSKRYGIGHPYVIEDLDIELRNGEITGVVGLNGGGKTTLLRMVAGLLEPTGGQREYPELRCTPTSWVTIRRRIAFVAQRPERWSGTVNDALTLQAACFGNTGKKGQRQVDFYIARLGLTKYRHFTWAQLSGGYRSRFELAKAMLSHPKMLVLDEPLAALDIPAQMRFLTDLEDFATEYANERPILVSSQHIYEVEAIAQNIIVIRDGKPVYNGSTRSVGENRKVNGFEISCDLGVPALTQMLAGCGLKSIRETGKSTRENGIHEFFLTTDRSVTAKEVLASLGRANAHVRHFRDASHSTRMFLES